MRDVYILSAVRTPIGKYGGSLAEWTAPDLGVAAARAALERAGVEAREVNEAIFGHARQAGNGPNPARQIAVRAGVPVEVPAYTVNQACASGLKAIALGFDQITLGRAEVVLAGGTEAMSRVPYFLSGALGRAAGSPATRRRHVSGRIPLSALAPGDGRDGGGAG